MTPRSRLFKVILPLLIIAAAMAVAALLIMLKKAPEKAPQRAVGALVDVMTVQRRDVPLQIRAAGTVSARQQISLDPQVSGRIIALGRDFASGAFFGRNDLLIQIEPTDYRLAVEQAAAALARAEVELATTESQAAIARSEWTRMQFPDGEQPNPLVLYEPQLKNSRANVASAAAAYQLAQLNLQRTSLRAPFAGRIRSEQVDIGQYVRAGTSVATLTGTDAAEIIVSVPLEDLGWLTIPGPQGGGGSTATVILAAGDNNLTWPGRIDRGLGEVDARGRMVQVAVLVDDPYRLQAKTASAPYLEVGLFVDVIFAGPLLEQVVELPRRALRDEQQVWVIDADGRLRIRPVEVLRRERETVLIGAGLEPGEQVILTSLTGVADGMQLRIASGDSQR